MTIIVKSKFKSLEISILLIILPTIILITSPIIGQNCYFTANFSTTHSNWISGFQKTNNGLIIDKASSSIGYQLQWNFTITGDANGVDEGRKLVMDDSGYLYVGGTIQQNTSSADLLLVKFNQNGHILWVRNLSSSGHYWDKGLGLTYYKNYLYLVGRYYVPGKSYEIAIAKYDTNGNLIWNITWGGINDDLPQDITAENDHIFITGYTKSWGTGLEDLIVAKFDLSGNLVWNFTWGTSNTDMGNGIIVKNYDIYVVGQTTISGNYQATIMRLLDLGTNYSIIWTKTWGGPQNDIGHDIAMDSNNSIYITGETSSFGLGNEDVFLSKFTITGVNLWNSTWGDCNSDIAYGISIDSNDNIFLTGHTKSYAADLYWDLFILQFDINGNMPWSITWHNGQYDGGFSTLSLKNSLYATGYTQAIGGINKNLIVLKYSIPAEHTITSSIPGFGLGYILLSLLISVFSLILYDKFKLNNLKLSKSHSYILLNKPIKIQ
ncbi:MAG: SBBP repeat-containing protein [Candidatus Helarchaeota archaeon]